MKKKADYSPCGDLLRSILSKDGWTLRGASQPLADAPDAVFVAQKQGRRIAFFFSDQAANKLTRAFKRIRQEDRGTFKLFGVLITPTTAEMQRLRHGDQADKYPRAFFASLEEIREAAAGGMPVEPERAGGIMSFKAEVMANTPVGGLHSAHYRLVFKAPFLQEVRPPQFIMMDTMPARVPLGARSVRRGNLRGAVDLAPRPLLKRPFGICRDFHPHFASDYLKHLRLPPVLALVLHPVLPDHFGVLYKVLPDGVGTALMTKLKRRQKVRMLGPLGRPFDVRRLRADGVEEVHVIGGGVGMAPLILLVEALRYYSFPVKVFLGIAKLESLRYRDELAATFGEKPRDAYIYIDDLLATGVPAADIYVACDSEVPSRRGGIVRGIPKENLFHGLVPEQYRQYLLDCHPERSEGPLLASSRVTDDSEVLHSAQNDKAKKPGSIVAFTCGPNRMIEVVAEIAQRASIPLKVLLEKRMACGIGVCFSCVQKVRRPNGTEDYARICTEGPLFDAKDILWKNDDSKQTSANSCCAPRC